MGIDKYGYIHITGNMHNYTDKVKGLYPARYLGQQILYWKSINPDDVTSRFKFVGEKNTSTAIPGTGFTYGRFFFTDNNENLYFSSRVIAIDAGHKTGQMGLGVYAYNADTSTWTALGGKADNIRAGTYYNVLLWENGGMAPDAWYQGFLTRLSFDSRNYLQMAATINSDPTIPGSDRLLYAFSKDAGASWYKTDGEQITTLPLRAKDGLPNQAEIVNEVESTPFLDSRTTVIADKHGTPGIINGPFYVHNENGWEKTTRFSYASTADWDDKENLVLTIGGSSKLLYTKSLNSNPSGHDFTGYSGYMSLDANALKKTGIAYAVGLKNATFNYAQDILRTIRTPAPLPVGWHGQDIADTTPVYGGTCGYRDGKFIVNDYGFHFGNTAIDSMYFVYTPFEGNGSITCKLSLNGPNLNSRAGVMMRESLDVSAKDVVTLIAPNKNGAAFSFRLTTGGNPGESWTLNLEDLNWVRLTRTGDVFTSFVSKDGVEWIKIGTRKIALASSLYIGLASASYNPAFMQATTFESVVITHE